MMAVLLLGDLAETLVVGSEEAAEKTRLALQLLDASGPDLGARAKAFKDAGHMMRQTGLAVPAKVAGVVNQQQVASQRKTGQHTLA